MLHTLHIDESGDFSAPHRDVTVTAVLTTSQTRQTLRRIDATLHRDLPFLPRPLHATDLNHPLYAAVCWAMHQSRAPAPRRPNLFANYLDALGWPSAAQAAIKRLLQRHEDVATAILKPINGSSPVPREALDDAWSFLQRDADFPHRRIESGRDAINAHVRRIIVAAQRSRGPITVICVGETRTGERHDGPDRYLALLRVLFRRTARTIATPTAKGTNSDPRRLAVYIARRDIQPRAGQSCEPMTSDAIRAILDDELQEIDGIASGFVQVEHYARDAELPLQLADWACNKSRRILGLHDHLLDIRPAVHKATALQPWSSATDRVTIAAAGAAASWLQGWVDNPESPPKTSRAGKPWAWEQARVWRDQLLDRRDT